MQRSFLINIAFLFLVNLVVKPFWIFGIDRTVQNLTGPENYGLYFAILNFSFMFYALADLGLNHHHSQRVAAEPDEFSDSFWPVFFLKIVFGGVYFVFCAALAIALGYRGEALSMLWFLLLNQVFISLLIYMRYNCSALHWFKTDSVLSVLDKLIASAICIPLIWGPYKAAEFDIKWLIYAQSAGLGLTAVIGALILLIKKAPRFKLPDLAYAKSQIRAALPFALLFVLMGLYQKTDGVMLERMRADGALQAGIYAASYRLLDAFSMFGFLMAGFLIPIYSRQISKGESVVPILRTSTLVVVVYTTLLSAAAVVYRSEIMSLLYHTDDRYWSDVFLWVILALNGTCLMYTFSSLLTADRRLSTLNRLAGAGFLLNIGLNIGLIPLYGALGAAAATLFTQLFIAGGQAQAGIRRFRIRPDWPLIGRGLLFVLGSAGCMAASKALPIGWIPGLIAGCLSGLLLSLLVGLVRPAHLRSLFSSGLSSRT